MSCCADEAATKTGDEVMQAMAGENDRRESALSEAWQGRASGRRAGRQVEREDDLLGVEDSAAVGGFGEKVVCLI